MALTKTQAKILAYLESNGPATIWAVADAFGFGHATACQHLSRLKKMKKIHSSGHEMRGRVSVRLFKAGPGQDVPSRRILSKIEAKNEKVDPFYELEQKEIAKRRAEALANAQMLLAKPNTVFGWLIERAR